MVSRRVRPIAKEEVETRSRERVSELPREVRDVTIFSALKSAGTAFASGRDWFARDSQCVVFFSSSFGYAAASVARGPFPVEIARSLARSRARASRARGPRVAERNLYHFLPGQPRSSVIILIRRWTFDDESRGGVVTSPPRDHWRRLRFFSPKRRKTFSEETFFVRTPIPTTTTTTTTTTTLVPGERGIYGIHAS